jgi:hypothetical protein
MRLRTLLISIVTSAAFVRPSLGQASWLSDIRRLATQVPRIINDLSKEENLKPFARCGAGTQVARLLNHDRRIFSNRALKTLNYRPRSYGCVQLNDLTFGLVCENVGRWLSSNDLGDFMDGLLLGSDHDWTQAELSGYDSNTVGVELCRGQLA